MTLPQGKTNSGSYLTNLNGVIASYYMNQKKTLEINPRHPLMKELLRRVEVCQCILCHLTHHVIVTG